MAHQSVVSLWTSLAIRMVDCLRITVLTKLGYLIDNPWSNALDRAKSAGRVLADVLMTRQLGVRPITLIGFSLGGRVIFYALLELAKQKAFGIVQDVFVLGSTITAPAKTWIQARSVVSGRFVNGYARNDWVLNYLFRATSGGLNTVAGLRPVTNVPGLENVDVTDKISGHMSYRTFMPLILDQLGFAVSADYFDDPVVCLYSYLRRYSLISLPSRNLISRKTGLWCARTRGLRSAVGFRGRSRASLVGRCRVRLQPHLSPHITGRPRPSPRSTTISLLVNLVIPL